MSGEKRQQAVQPSSSASVPMTSFALDGDVAGGSARSMTKTNAYLLESIGGRNRQYMSAAVASEDERPVFGVCDELQTFMMFNKLYGQEIVWRGDDGAEKSLPLFSAFHPRQHRVRLRQEDFIYQPTFGGKRVAQLRPLLMCRRTVDVLAHAGSDFGWRSLLYVNKGDDDSYPSGIVAMEGWLFERVEREVKSPTTGKTYVMEDGVDMDDLDEYARRITAVTQYAATRVSEAEPAAAAATVTAAAVTDGAFVAPPRPPRVVDADDDDEPLDGSMFEA